MRAARVRRQEGRPLPSVQALDLDPPPRARPLRSPCPLLAALSAPRRPRGRSHA